MNTIFYLKLFESSWRKGLLSIILNNTLVLKSCCIVKTKYLFRSPFFLDVSLIVTRYHHVIFFPPIYVVDKLKHTFKVNFY